GSDDNSPALAELPKDLHGVSGAHRIRVECVVDHGDGAFLSQLKPVLDGLQALHGMFDLPQTQAKCPADRDTQENVAHVVFAQELRLEGAHIARVVPYVELGTLPPITYRAGYDVRPFATVNRNRPHLARRPVGHAGDVLVVDVEHGDAVRLQLLDHRALFLRYELHGTHGLQMGDADRRHHTYVRSRDGTELGHVSRMPDAHLEHKHLVLRLKHLVDHDAQAHRCIIRGRAGQDVEALPQNLGDNEFRTRLPVGAGNRHDRQIRPLGQAHTRAALEAGLNRALHRCHEMGGEVDPEGRQEVGSEKSTQEPAYPA